MPTILGQSRTRLTLGDPDRNWLYVWTRDESLTAAGTYKLIADKGNVATPLPRQHLGWAVEWEDIATHGGVQLPTGPGVPALRPGAYKLDVGRGLEGLLTILPAATPRKVTLIQPGESGDSAAAAWFAGHDVRLAPGEHVWRKSIAMPDGASLFAYGATIRREPTYPPEGGNEPFIRPGNDCTVKGATFQHESGGMVFWANPGVHGLVVTDCTFRRCNFGFYIAEALVRDCTFWRAGVGVAPSGLYLRCYFQGPGQFNPWDLWSANSGNTALIDSDFVGTKRGPIFNTNGGAITDNLFLGIRCSNINTENNGGEMFLVEGPNAFDRNVIMHARATGCVGSFCQFDQVARDNLVLDLVVDGGFGFNLWGADVGRNEVRVFELRDGAGIYCGTGSYANLFGEGIITGWVPSKYNQGWMNTSPLGYKRTVAAWSESQPSAKANTLRSVFLGPMGATVTPAIGFDIKPQT